MQSFWHTLPTPFFVLAPMEGVTDSVFRQIVAQCAKPDVFFTEFVSVDGFCSSGRDAMVRQLEFEAVERPVIAQIWGNNPDHFYRTAKEICTWGFAGIDINMGCPVRDVVRHGSGAALIDNPGLAGEIISSTRAGIRDAGSALDVSVKTRIGNTTVKTGEWISFLLDQHIQAITVHGRTAREMSLVPAHWDEISKAVTLRNQKGSATVVIGNGDARDLEDARTKAAVSGADGIMIGRGILTNPWAFDRGTVPYVPTKHERLLLLKRHIGLFAVQKGERTNYAVLKKYFKIYLHGFAHAADMRARFMHTETASEALGLLDPLISRP